MYTVRTAETEECYDSFAETESVVNKLLFQYGVTDVTVTDNYGMTYLPKVTLEAEVLPKWFNGIPCNDYCYAQA